MRKCIRRCVKIGLVAYLMGLLVFFVAVFRTDAQPADLAVVLGTTVYPSGKLSPWLQSRVDHAYDLYHTQQVRYILVSGGVGVEGVDEAQAMANYLKDRGVPDSAIFIDSNGVNTHATAKYALELSQKHGFKSMTVVSQYFHVPRARMIMQAMGYPVVYGAYPDYVSVRDLYSVNRELIAYPYYFFFK